MSTRIDPRPWQWAYPRLVTSDIERLAQLEQAVIEWCDHESYIAQKGMSEMPPHDPNLNPSDEDAIQAQYEDFQSQQELAIIAKEEFLISQITSLYRVIELRRKRLFEHFTEFDGLDASEIKKIENRFQAVCGRSINDVLHAAEVDELRMLNNAIKHHGAVTKQLANNYPGWIEGAPFSKLSETFKRISSVIPVYFKDLAEQLQSSIPYSL